jgi:pyruvate,water dikinase
VVTETGSAAGHFASVAREYGVPLLVNAGNALKLLSPGSDVSVHADEGVVYKGLVEAIANGGCDRPEPISGSPFARRLSSVMSFISPLRLVDPEADGFKPMGCRSMHDIIRYCHETAVRQMFQINDRRIRKLGGSKKLDTGIPMQFLVLDVGGGLEAASDSGKTVDVNQIVCPALKAVVEGLSHPEIQWGDFSHFDWAEHDRIVMSGGIISPEAAMFASHVVVSEDYANMNLRFGYHFVIIDTICGEPAANNHILFRFSGGGADFTKRMLRADFLGTILQRLEFEVHRKSDLVDAELKAVDKERILEKLDMLGRLLGASRLMDMYLKDASMVAAYADQFMQGRYHFSTTDL